MSAVNQHIIGLSGHIDHGKTSIVKALTGINTDNLKEETKRGMTINIGFAFLNNQITMIDVPGHEKFIKNMVTGVNAIDYVLLVIAADDGIMPQTIEHFEILKLFNVVDGSIIINKVDMVEQEWLELVEKDIAKFVRGSFLENKKIHKVSAIKNIGLIELKDYLINYNYNIHRKNSDVFRLFVDRIFTSKGFGSVITGTVLSGKIRIGDKLKILPQNKEIKVRGLQTHNESVQELKIGDRGAINIHSIDKILIEKGNHISEKGFFSTYESAIVSIKILNKVEKGVKDNERLRVYCGTQEVMARIKLFNDKELKPNEETGALLKFEKPLILSIGDNFIIRKYSPLVTIGGGQILDFSIYKKWRDNKTYISNLYNAKDEHVRLALIIESKDIDPFNFISFSSYVNISVRLLKNIIKQIPNIIVLEDEWILTDKQLNRIINNIIEYFKNFHKKNPYKNGMIKDEIMISLNINENFLDVILNYLVQKKNIKYYHNNWSKYDFSIELSNNEIKLMDKIYKIINDKKLHAITISELLTMFNDKEKMIKKLLNIKISNKTIIMLDGTLLFTQKNIDLLIDTIRKYFGKNQSLDIKTFKELTSTSRKFAVPLLEYLDKIHITYRLGNERKLKE